jgi:hypothetical protein
MGLQRLFLDMFVPIYRQTVFFVAYNEREELLILWPLSVLDLVWQLDYVLVCAIANVLLPISSLSDFA